MQPLACSYPKIAEDLKVGISGLVDSLVLEVIEVNPATKSVKARAVNTCRHWVRS
jgi:hypothetical protein